MKLGDDPARTIPLFAGLRPAQARIVVLMGELRRFAPGETIVRRGERRRRDVRHHPRRDRRVRGQRCGSGATSPDTAAATSSARWASSATTSAAPTWSPPSVEVLAVDERFLERIQRRYPRIASKVFLNLTRILSDRLQRTTDQYVAVQTPAS